MYKFKIIRPWFFLHKRVVWFWVVISPQICCCSATPSCLTLFYPMDCNTPGFPVLHHLPELAQTHVHWVSDAFQPSCPLLSSSPPAFSLSQHQGLYQGVSSSRQVTKVFSLSISPSNEYSWLISFRTDWFDLLPVQGTLKSSPTPQFKSINSLVLSLLYGSTLTFIHDFWKNHSFD